MDWLELLERVASGEDSFTEFKEESAHQDELAAEIVAFANTQGGLLILGVSDDRQIVGISNPDGVMQRIDQITYNNVNPPMYCTIEKVSDGAKTVLIVQIPRGPEKPYRTNRGIYYIRTASGKRQATREELLRLYQAALALFPDELPISNSGVNDLDIASFEQFFQRFYGQTIKETSQELNRLLANSKLLSQENATVAGILAFGRDPQQFLPFAKISAVRFEGTEISERILDRKEITGILKAQITSAETFLKIHIVQIGEIRGFHRKDETALPMEALREAVVNAVAHRDYTLKSQIRILVFDNRVEVISPGKLPNTVTLESMRLGVHLERNPIIVTLLTKLGFMSQIGTGIPRMFRLMRDRGLSEPEISATEAEVKVGLKFS